jgi:LacI family transcriptional regulator
MHPRRVALLVETSRAFGRGVIQGVNQYSREQGTWSIQFTPLGLDDRPPGWLKGWQGDGILARIENRAMAEAVLALGVPVVELRGRLVDLPFPHIGVDAHAVIDVAVEHLAARGLRHFAFIGVPQGEYVRMDERREQFLAITQARGLSRCVYPSGLPQQSTRGWELQQQRLARWVEALPKPVGVIAPNDDCGLRILEACRRAGVSVPEQAAVVSVDNDEYLCMLSTPPLSSVDIMPQHVGYQAAALLNGMMQGIAPKEMRIRTAPGPVVVRQSSDILATDDRPVVAAVEFIRENACQRIQVSDVARHVGLSPTAIGQRLRKVLGRTVYQEIQRVQIDRVRELLSESDLPLKQIARHCGFKYTQHMARVFREATGRTLMEYRRQTRM